MVFVYFLFGAIFGSAANALIYRLPRNISWAKGHSMCPHCKHQLHTKDLIPLVSYITLGGRCRYCKKAIGIHYFLVELFLATGFAFLTGNPLLCGILWITTIIAVMDWETKLVSEVLVLIWGLFVVAQRFITSYSAIDLNMVLGVFVGVGVIGGIWAISRGRAMGFGDVEIAVVMGLWLGWPNIVVALWMAFVTGAIGGVILLINSKRKTGLKSEIAFGPFLILGSWIGYVFGTQMLRYLYV